MATATATTRAQQEQAGDDMRVKLASLITRARSIIENTRRHHTEERALHPNEHKGKIVFSADRNGNISDTIGLYVAGPPRQR